MKRLKRTLLLLGMLTITSCGAFAQEFAQVSRGSITKTVFGSGTIQPASQPGVYAKLDGTILEYCVGLGDSVQKGDILARLDSASLDAQQKDLEYKLTQAQQEVEDTKTYSQVQYRVLYDDDGEMRWDVNTDTPLLGKFSNELSIRSPAAGRIKAIYIAPGDDALAVYREKGAVMLLSTDGRMKVELADMNAEGLALGDSVMVAGDGFKAKGVISDLYRQGTRMTVLVTGDTYPMDAPVTVSTADGWTIGEGILKINRPLAVSAYGGTIKGIAVKVGKVVERDAVLARFIWEEMPLYIDNQNSLIDYAKAQTELAGLTEKRDSLVLVSPCDGQIATIDAAAGDDVQDGTKLLSVVETAAGMTVTLSVDELDIISVQPGQRVVLSVDALSDVTILGTVERIAPIGNTESSTTTYDVFVHVGEVDPRVLGGMNVTGEIEVLTEDHALLVPTDALVRRDGRWHVVLADGGMAQVEIGVMTQDMTEIRSGVNEGDTVVY